MPMTLMRVSAWLEEEWYLALPQRRHKKIMSEINNINPEVYHDVTVCGAVAECQMNFEDATVKCGLGEIGLNGKVLCDEFGPFLRYVFILTDAELEATPHVTVIWKKKDCLHENLFPNSVTENHGHLT